MMQATNRIANSTTAAAPADAATATTGNGASVTVVTRTVVTGGTNAVTGRNNII